MSDQIESKPDDFNKVEAAVALDTVQNTLEKLLESATIDVVYGKPIKTGETLIIPTAEILTGMGFGVAYGSSEKSGTSRPDQAGSGGGGGGGGGGRVLSRPVAVVIASPEGVRIEPVFDVTKVGIAALTTIGFMLGMSIRMLRGPRYRRR
jgi:uncharacterized spore protein YtfJ